MDIRDDYILGEQLAKSFINTNNFDEFILDLSQKKVLPVFSEDQFQIIWMAMNEVYIDARHLFYVGE
jgi:hypothetical protein